MRFSHRPYFLAPPSDVTARQRRASDPCHCVSCARHVQILKFPPTLFRRHRTLPGVIHKVSQQQIFRVYRCTTHPADRCPFCTPSRYVIVLQTSCIGVWRADRHLLSVRVLTRIRTVLNFPLAPDRSTHSGQESCLTRPHPQGNRKAICTSPRCERCNHLSRG